MTDSDPTRPVCPGDAVSEPTPLARMRASSSTDSGGRLVAVLVRCLSAPGWPTAGVALLVVGREVVGKTYLSVAIEVDALPSLRSNCCYREDFVQIS